MFFEVGGEAAVPFCKIQGCSTNTTEVPPFCVTELSGKAGVWGHACPLRKKIIPTVSLQYVQSTLQASATDTKHTIF